MSNLVYDGVVHIGSPNEQATGIPGMAQPTTFNLVIGDDALFSTRAPQSGNIKVVKLTEDNLRAVGAYIFRTSDYRVEIVDGVLCVGPWCFSAGDWVIEYYDYYDNKIRFRRANSREREKYDLR